MIIIIWLSSQKMAALAACALALATLQLVACGRNLQAADLIGDSRAHREIIASAEPSDDYLFDDEYDDLFSLADYRKGQRRGRRSGASKLTSAGDIAEPLAAEAFSSERPIHRKTIYFGGFFPWLSGEQTERTTSDGAHRLAGHDDSMATFEGDGRDSQSHWSMNGREQKTRKPRTQRQQSRASKKPGRHSQDEASSALMNLPSSNDNNGAGDNNNHSLSHKNQFQQRQQQHHQQQRQQVSNQNQPQYSSETRHQLGKFILPAVRLALDHINNNHSILNSYTLEVVPRDTECNATISLKQFFDMVYEAPKKMLLYGDACRVSTDPIAKASYFFDLIQISYADTDPIYTIENYPNFFRVVPSENALSLARIPFIRHFNWTRVGTIYQNLPRYSLPHSKLLTDLERYKIVIKQSVSLPGSVDSLQNRDLGDELRKLKDRDVRIILGNFDEEWALLLFCEAYREEMIGRKYQWILTGFSESKLWQMFEQRGSSCTKKELLIAMDGYIITDIAPITRSQHKTISGLLAHEYLDEYKRRAHEMNISIEDNKFYGYVYDGIWAIALALNRVDTKLKFYHKMLREGKVEMKPELSSISSLLDFEYHQPIWVRLIRNALKKTKFEGVTGTVSFQKNERPGLITFLQFQPFRDLNEVVIGSYDALNDELDLKVGFPIFWRGSSPPIDYTIERVTPFRINRTIFVIISIMAILGIVLACIFLFVNIKFRNQRYIKMSSPYLNNLIIIGCILTFTSVIILGLDSGLTSEYNFPYICNARAWVLMAGFTLAFGSMFSKTFRVHSIFTNIKLHKKVIKDYKLFVVVFILLTFDVCILVVWQYFDPFYRETNNGTIIQDPDNEDILIVPEMEHCQSKRMSIFLGVIYVYKGLLMAFGCFLAWETRHVSIPALNDSKYIGLSVYNVVIMCVIGASLSFILRDQQDASFVIISIFIIFCSATTLCLVFVPKLIELKQNPRANDHRVRATLKTFKKNYHEEAFGVASCRDIHGNLIGRAAGYGVAAGYNLNERIKLMLEENNKQRSLLKEKIYELEALTSKYRKIQSMIQSGQYLQAIGTTSVGAGGGDLEAGAQSSSSALAGPTTTMLLTSRSPTRERVSFTGTPVRKQAELDDKLAPVVAAAQRQQATQRAGGSNPAITSATRGSPIMSSATFATTTSSAANNTTDITADIATTTTSSSKLISASGNNTTSSSGAILCSAHELGDRVQAISQQVAASQLQHRRQFGSQLARKLDGSLIAEPVLVAGSKCHESCEELNLFTILSCIDSQRPCPAAAAAAAATTTKPLDESAGTKQVPRRAASTKLGAWLGGPFCTLMLRRKQLDGAQHADALLSGALKKQSSWRQAGELGQCWRAQQMWPPTKSMLARHAGAHLPRTLSMIEYLGLSEFDLIARRHERILRYRQRKRMQLAGQQRLFACCLIHSNSAANACSCCFTHSQPQGLGAGLEHRPAGSGRREASAAHATRSDGNLAFASSCEPLNSDEELELAQSASVSCSTCCSLVSPTYGSQSDIFRVELSSSNNNNNDNNNNNNNTSTTGSSRSSGPNNSLLLLDGSQSSLSSSASMSSLLLSRSMSLAAITAPRRCPSFEHSQHSSDEQSSSIVEAFDERQHQVARICHHAHQHVGARHRHGAPSPPPARHAHHQQHLRQQQLHASHKPASLQASSDAGPAEACSPATHNGRAQASSSQLLDTSLCTSGVLYGVPAGKEGANQAAHLAAERQPSSGATQAAVDKPEQANDGAQDADAEPRAQKLSIRCDVLESL